jgi:hypothetical protein
MLESVVIRNQASSVFPGRKHASELSGDPWTPEGKFASSGFVHLQHCGIGQNRVLLIELAKTFGVPVYAGTGKHNAM